MKKLIVLVVIAFAGIGISCGRSDKSPKETFVLIKTEFGNMKVMLYDETPEHKKNFIKLAEEGYYNGLIFHRVINHFMIQGGDPNSRNAAPGVRLGAGNPGYTIPAEFVPKYFHKKGVLSAARTGGPSNPEKRSSGSQFYIVHGEVFTPGKLDTVEMMLNGRAKNEILREKFNAANTELTQYRVNQDEAGFNACVAAIRAEIDSIFEVSPQVVFTPEQREAYTTVGGYPSLDGEYTVFGEVVEGFDVLDKIAAVETDQNDRPLSDIKMEIEVIR